jgi:hypothetical protein
LALSRGPSIGSSSPTHRPLRPKGDGKRKRQKPSPTPTALRPHSRPTSTPRFASRRQRARPSWSLDLFTP